MQVVVLDGSYCTGMFRIRFDTRRGIGACRALREALLFLLYLLFVISLVVLTAAAAVFAAPRPILSMYFLFLDMF